MDNLKYFFLLALTISCTSPKKTITVPEADPFVGMKGCFLLYNLKTQTLVKQLGTSCEERFPACSTFKVPLAVMAFDAQVLKDEKQTLKWDGQKRWLDSWNQDHNAATWMRDSVVWFSQKITPILGKAKFQRYLNEFDYGNKDFSTGLTQAWLNPPNHPKGFLGLSPHEQLEFMKKLWREELPVSKRAMELTKEITYLETSPHHYKLSGKTGSGFYDKAKKIQLGWFIAHVGKGDEEYIAVTNISDLAPIETTSFGGPRAKEITKKLLENNGLW